LAALVSLVVVETFDMFVIVDPDSALELTWTTNVKLAPALAASVALLAVNVPVPPTAGGESVNAGPEVCVADTNVVLAGIASVRLTLWASLGPELVSVIV